MNQDVIRKIKALLAKEGAAGTTPQEIAASVALAMRLMEREGITRAALEAEGQSSEPTESADIFDVPLAGEIHKSMITWKLRLASVISKSRGCYNWMRGGAIQLAGRPSDVDAVRYLFSYCAQEIERIAKLHGKGNGKTWNNNFKLGCVDAVAQSIENEKHAERQAQRAAATNAHALIVVNNAIAKVDTYYLEAKQVAYSKLKFGKPKVGHSITNDYGARAAGQSAGASIYPGQRKAIGGTRAIRG